MSGSNGQVTVTLDKVPLGGQNTYLFERGQSVEFNPGCEEGVQGALARIYQVLQGLASDLEVTDLRSKIEKDLDRTPFEVEYLERPTVDETTCQEGILFGNTRKDEDIGVLFDPGMAHLGSHAILVSNSLSPSDYEGKLRNLAGVLTKAYKQMQHRG